MFQPGQSGNPKGRPKGTYRKVTTRDLLNSKIDFSSRVFERVEEKTDALIDRLLEEALKGDIRVLMFIFYNCMHRMHRVELKEEQEVKIAEMTTPQLQGRLDELQKMREEVVGNTSQVGVKRSVKKLKIVSEEE
ncbi:MAG TPA: DUF5681 domain-containing protein [Candidatus Babeliaceae bacterium]|nr:DUF5681 domain-containing protein [Candidatus Babeliaceae bacterium]